MSSSSSSVRSGLDVLVAQRFRPLRGLRLGGVCNPTAVDQRLDGLVDLLHAAEGLRLVRLFGPEHGVRGSAQDMVGVDGQAVDARTGLPVVSLYGDRFESLRPTLQSLEGLDALVFDIQDIG
ncbi:MAG: exo-beta-N-acetylmuramidase NamZ domain-containing protein, partial [Deltaproteobacteria bacterium]